MERQKSTLATGLKPKLIFYLFKYFRISNLEGRNSSIKLNK